MASIHNRLFTICCISLCVSWFSACEEKARQSPPNISIQDSILPMDTVAAKEKVVEEMSEVVLTVAPDFDTTQWAEIKNDFPNIILDIRYATTNNFVEEQLYECPRCFLRPKIAEQLMAVYAELQEQNLGIKLFDCYRPLPIQQKLWNKVPNASYVTPPKRGSMHNKGAAIDITIIDSTGQELEMGTEYDYFGKEAHHTYTGHSETINQNRYLLKTVMRKNGFRGIRTEWWHYSMNSRQNKIASWEWPCPPASPEKDK